MLVLRINGENYVYISKYYLHLKAHISVFQNVAIFVLGS